MSLNWCEKWLTILTIVTPVSFKGYIFLFTKNLNKINGYYAPTLFIALNYVSLFLKNRF